VSANPHLPTGTVTFLFTDIEGSTLLWEAHPEAMGVTLARHDALVREAIVRANGYVFKTVGDAFCAAFAMAPDAVSAVLAAQRAIVAEPWPEATPIKVRMVVHTGAVESRDGDYFGPALNRVARLLPTGHGGQTLLSQATYDLVRDTLPDAVTLRDLGLHQLKDLARPEQVYQLQHPRLPGDFPPIKSLSTHPNNLPQQVTSFVGREKEMAELEALLGKTRLLTLTGAGGAGKTRLSLQMAAAALEQFPDGAWLIELAARTDPALVPQTVATALGLREEPGKPLTRTLFEHLKTRRMLLLLDNCEHLLAACATLTDTLLQRCPDVKILATSREALGIQGEQTYRVPSMSLPDRKQTSTPQTLSTYESVRLFIDRALAVRTDFAVTNANAPALASVCCHLDGIPLAIELAAARVRTLAVEEIDSKLDERFRLLTGGSKTALPRQQTLRALIDWSYDLLNEPERLLLQRLSVFADGWALKASEAACAGEGIAIGDVLDLLTSLADKSLVIAEQTDGRTRYRLLETVREYAREKLGESGHEEAVRERHRDYFLALAEEAFTKLMGAEQAEWLRRLEDEHENLRTGLDWSLAGARPREGLRLCGALQRFWWTRGHLAEGREWCARFLDKAGAEERTTERANVLNAAGGLAHFQGDYAVALARHEESLAISRQLGDRKGMAASLGNLGAVAYDQSDYPRARMLMEECLTIARGLGHQAITNTALGNLASIASEQGDYASAVALYGECLAIARELRDVGSVATLLANLGNVACKQGDLVASRAFFEESLAIGRELEDRRGIASALTGLGNVARGQGDYASARAWHEKTLAIGRELGDRREIADSLNNLGTTVREQGDYSHARALYAESLAMKRELGDGADQFARTLEGLTEMAVALGAIGRAARIWGTAQRLREQAGAPLSPDDKTRYDRRVAAARAALGNDTAFDHAWQEGRAMTLEQAIELALEETIEQTRSH